ncbi:MAG: hypothetical protein AAF497_28510, partial [Planctomycetota bacterium]
MPVVTSRRTAVLSLAMLALAATSHSPTVFADHTPSHPELGLEGYCPVCIVSARKWEKGRPEINSTYDGTTYYFPNAAIKAKFDASPPMYIPALGGDCIVCYEKMGKRAPGNIRHAALHRGRLYLFPGDSQKQAFLANPTEYENSDLAAKGECVVCLAKAGKHVPGSTTRPLGDPKEGPTSRRTAAMLERFRPEPLL